MEELKVLVELRAGKMGLSADNRLVADTRKGMLRVAQSEDTLTHVLWYERVGSEAKGEPLDDIVVFPEECKLEAIQGQPRCYVLRFPQDSSRNVFFWLQEPKAESDGPLVTRFNLAVDGKELPPLQQPAPATAPAAAAVPPAQVAAAGGAGSSRHPAAAAAAAANPANPQASALAALLSSALAAAGQPQPQQPDPNALARSLLAQMMGGKRAQVDEGPGLHEVLRPELVVPLVREEGMLGKLAPHLPEEHRSLDHLVATVQSPQFQQQLATFSHALQSGQLDLQQFGLQAKGFSVADFLEAVQDMVDKQRAKDAGEGGSAPTPMEH